MRLLRDQKGATAIEFGLIASLISLAVVAGLATPLPQYGGFTAADVLRSPYTVSAVMADTTGAYDYHKQYLTECKAGGGMPFAKSSDAPDNIVAAMACF